MSDKKKDYYAKKRWDNSKKCERGKESASDIVNRIIKQNEENDMIELSEIIENIPELSSERNYWFFRTDGGRLYQAFNDQSLISIGYPEISVAEIIENEEHRNELRKIIEEKYPESEKPGLILSQLCRFAFEIEEGDIVVIPDSGSNNLAIGEVYDNELIEADILFEKAGRTYIDEDFKKARNIRWMKWVSKREFSPKLYQLFNNRQAIVNACDYSRWIDPHIHDFFKKGNKYHLNLNIGTTRKINARELFSCCLSLFDITDDILYDSEIPQDTTDFDTAINLNSPGTVELISEHGPYALTLIGICILAVNGGKLNFSFKESTFELGTDGLIKRLNEFLNSRTDRKLKETINNQISNLDIQDPGDIIGIVDAINKRNQNE